MATKMHTSISVKGQRSRSPGRLMLRPDWEGLRTRARDTFDRCLGCKSRKKRHRNTKIGMKVADAMHGQ